jgi:hypothetical protein
VEPRFDTKEELIGMKTIVPSGKWLADGNVNTWSGFAQLKPLGYVLSP